jgi:hypothetical protein
VSHYFQLVCCRYRPSAASVRRKTFFCNVAHSGRFTFNGKSSACVLLFSHMNINGNVMAGLTGSRRKFLACDMLQSWWRQLKNFPTRAGAGFHLSTRYAGISFAQPFEPHPGLKCRVESF